MWPPFSMPRTTNRHARCENRCLLLALNTLAVCIPGAATLKYLHKSRVMSFRCSATCSVCNMISSYCCMHYYNSEGLRYGVDISLFSRHLHTTMPPSSEMCSLPDCLLLVGALSLPMTLRRPILPSSCGEGGSRHRVITLHPQCVGRYPGRGRTTLVTVHQDFPTATTGPYLLAQLTNHVLLGSGMFYILWLWEFDDHSLDTGVILICMCRRIRSDAKLTVTADGFIMACMHAPSLAHLSCACGGDPLNTK